MKLGTMLLEALIAAAILAGLFHIISCDKTTATAPDKTTADVTVLEPTASPPNEPAPRHCAVIRPSQFRVIRADELYGYLILEVETTMKSYQKLYVRLYYKKGEDLVLIKQVTLEPGVSIEVRIKLPDYGTWQLRGHFEVLHDGVLDQCDRGRTLELKKKKKDCPPKGKKRCPTQTWSGEPECRWVGPCDECEKTPVPGDFHECPSSPSSLATRVPCCTWSWEKCKWNCMPPPPPPQLVCHVSNKGTDGNWNIQESQKTMNPGHASHFNNCPPDYLGVCDGRFSRTPHPCMVVN